LEAPLQTRLTPRCFTPDGARLIGSGVETRALHIWDLQAIREQLAKMGLEGDLPSFESGKERKPAPPLQVQVELGTAFEFLPGGYRTSIGLNSFLVALNPFNFEAYLHRAQAYSRLGEWHKAVSDYSMFLAWAAPDDKRRAEALLGFADVCNSLAWALAMGPDKERDPAKALPLAKKAVELRPDQRDYLNTLGVVYNRLGQLEQAIEMLERSYRESKGQAIAYDLFFLAMCHALRGDAANAKDCYDRGLRGMQEQQNRLSARAMEELNAIRAEAEGLLQAETRQPNK